MVEFWSLLISNDPAASVVLITSAETSAPPSRPHSSSTNGSRWVPGGATAGDPPRGAPGCGCGCGCGCGAVRALGMPPGPGAGCAPGRRRVPGRGSAGGRDPGAGRGRTPGRVIVDTPPRPSSSCRSFRAIGRLPLLVFCSPLTSLPRSRHSPAHVTPLVKAAAAVTAAALVIGAPDPVNILASCCYLVHVESLMRSIARSRTEADL